MSDDFEEEEYYLRDAIEGSAKLRDAVNRLRLCNAPIVWFEPVGVSPMFRRARPPKQRRFHKSRPKTKYCIPPLVAHETPVHHPRIERIKEWVASHFEIHPVWMAHPDRHWSVSHPRQIAMYLARKMAGASFPTIGRHFNRDHTSVIHGVRRIERMMASDSDLAADVEVLRARLTA